MTIEESIKTAIEHEIKVSELYAESAQNIPDRVGKNVLQVLAKEEKRHVEYLNFVLDNLKKTGKVTTETLDTAVPSQKDIADGINKLKTHMAKQKHRVNVTGELDILYKALDVEIETSNFYKKMVNELGDEGQQLFGQFIQIEEGHQAIVQAEIDYLTGTGFWFDFREFSLEVR